MEVIKDILVADSGGFVYRFGGGTLFGKCKKCGGEFGAQDIPFPGTKEQQKPTRKVIAEKFAVHQCP